jgi:hypothetical protein
MLAVVRLHSDAAALLPRDEPKTALLPPELLDAAAEAVLPLAVATAAASSPETVGGRGVAGSANGVQSGGPDSKGEDFARAMPLAEAMRAGLLLGEALLLRPAGASS